LHSTNFPVWVITAEVLNTIFEPLNKKLEPLNKKIDEAISSMSFINEKI
jgi:hypothetical protein